MNPKYLKLTFLLLAIEIFIAVYVHDSFVRPFFGDFLAVIFVYCGLRIFMENSFKTAIGSLCIAYFIETLQFFKFIEITGLIKYKVLAILIGNSFSWYDILAYTLGFMAILLVEYFSFVKFFFLIKINSIKS